MALVASVVLRTMRLMFRESRPVVIFFNPDKTVDSYVFNTSFPEEKRAWKNR